MKSLIILLAAFSTLIGGFNDIATINRLKREAEAALQQNNYAQAAKYYTQLVDSLQVTDEAVRLNLAHASLMAGDTIAAQSNYSQLTASEDRSLRSVAYQQMGVVASSQKKYEEALAIFKESLKANPANEEARYNYELVKKLLQQQQEQEQQDQEQEGEDSEQEQQEDQQQEGEQESEEQQGEQSEEEGEQSEEQQSGEQEQQEAEEQEAQEGQSESEEGSEEEAIPPPISEKLKEMNISEEKAQMILEAMRNNEMQYIQQNRRKPEKPRDRTKPDW